jgi:hypothetical protein
MKEGNEMNGPRLEEFRIISIGINVFEAPVGTKFLFGVVGVFPICSIYGLAQYDGRAIVPYRFLVTTPGDLKPGHFAAIEKHIGSVKVHLDPEVLHVFQLKPTKEI